MHSKEKKDSDRSVLKMLRRLPCGADSLNVVVTSEVTYLTDYGGCSLNYGSQLTRGDHGKGNCNCRGSRFRASKRSKVQQEGDTGIKGMMLLEEQRPAAMTTLLISVSRANVYV